MLCWKFFESKPNIDEIIITCYGLLVKWFTESNIFKTWGDESFTIILYIVLLCILIYVVKISISY